MVAVSLSAGYVKFNSRERSQNEKLIYQYELCWICFSALDEEDVVFGYSGVLDLEAGG